MPVSIHEIKVDHIIDNKFAIVVDTETGLAEDKKDERSRLTATVREIERFLSDGLVKV